MLDHDTQERSENAFYSFKYSHNNFTPDSNLPGSMRQIRRIIPEKDAEHRALLGLDSTEPVDRLVCHVRVLFRCPCVPNIQVLTYSPA